MPLKIFKRNSFNNAEQFKESFFEPEPATNGYVFLARNLNWNNEDSPDIPKDSYSYEKQIWDSIFAAKKITGNDVELVIPKTQWQSNYNYRQFDDTIEISDLLSSNSQQNLSSMYVYTSERNVYKCLSNNLGSLSTVEPTGDYSTSNGNISTADGYIWKYMYNVRTTNKFLTEDWIPIPTSVDKLDYNVSSTNLVEGEIHSIVIENSGLNYSNVTTNAISFIANSTTITLSDVSNVSSNMLVSGTGIQTGTYITGLDTFSGIINLSAPTTANGGGDTVANTITISTRLELIGDGFGFGATAIANANGNIDSIQITSFGRNYTRANVFIYGNGTGAVARPIISPKFGHGFNPAKELCANNVMVVSKFGELDSTEGGLISNNTSFRQYGFLRNPHKYGSNVAVSKANANTVISQTTNLTTIVGSNFEIGEFVYQGSLSSPSFYGYVHDQTTTSVRTTNVSGNPSVGISLIGANSGVSRVVTVVQRPEFEPYTGEILYVENVQKIERAESQAETIKFVVKF